MILLADYLQRMGCALLTGALIGVERQCRQRDAGLRTNVLVAIGAAAFTLLSCSMTQPGYGDPSRVAAQIVSGVGFLGGGLILKDGLSVRGLNTAATIWCSAACGTLSGVGMFVEAFVTVGCVLAAHVFLRPLGRYITWRTTKKTEYVLHAECGVDDLETARRVVREAFAFDRGIRLNSLSYVQAAEGVVSVRCNVELAADHVPALDMVVSRLRSRIGAVNAGWERKQVLHDEY